MLQLIIDFLTTPVINGQPVLAIGPLALAGIGAGINLLGGLFSGSKNRRTRVNIPPELQDQIDQLSNQNYFLPALQRAVNNDQGFYNINASLAARGVDSPMIANEQQQAMEARRQSAITQGLDQLEGLRLSALNRSIGQLNQLNMANANFRQQQTENTLGIINSATSGIGSSIIQGLGYQSMQDALKNLAPTGQVGGQGFNILDQFSVGGPNQFDTGEINDLDGGIFAGIGGGGKLT